MTKVNNFNTCLLSRYPICIFPWLGWYDRLKATKGSVNRTRYSNWIAVKPVALNRALICGDGGGLDVGGQ